MHKKTRYIMLGIFCAGLLLIGIGVGVLGLEFSQFTYGGTKYPEGETDHLVETVSIGETDMPILLESYLLDPNGNLEAMAKIQVSEEMKPGTVKVEASYQKVPGVEVYLSSHMEDACGYITLRQYQYSPVATMLSYKDWMLKDLKDRIWCEYIPLRMDGVEITVNPADRERIRLASSADFAPAVEYYTSNDAIAVESAATVFESAA